MKFDKAYFIAKFTAISDEDFCRDDFARPDGRKCALGHCGVTRGAELYTLPEAIALRALFQPYINATGLGVASINDGDCSRFQQSTPKARILAALNELPD